MNAEIETAADKLSTAIKVCMEEYRDALEPGEHVYAVALVILDDFSDLQAYANTDQHFAETEGRDLDRWYFGEFESEGMPVEFECLTEHLGEVSDGDQGIDDKANWLAAMTLAMQRAKADGVFKFDDEQAMLFCSIVDSYDAIWLEDLTARKLNSPAKYAAAANGIRNAAKEWYQADGDRGSAAIRSAYESRLTE